MWRKYPWNWDHDGRGQRLGRQGQNSESGNRQKQVRLGLGNFDIKIVTFLWFMDGVTPQDRKRVQLDLQQALVRAPIEVKGEHVRSTLETAPDKRPWNEAQAIFLRTMRENAGLTKEQFDMRWVSTGIRVSVNGAPPRCLAVPLPVASITIGQIGCSTLKIFKILPREPMSTRCRPLWTMRDAGGHASATE